MNLTVASGYSVMNASPISVNEAVNEAAAKTVTSPVTVGSGAAESSASDPQEAATRPSSATATSRSVGVLRMTGQTSHAVTI